MSDSMVLLLAGLAGETLLLVFVALVVSWVRNRAARRRDRKAMQALVARVKQAKPEREALIGQFLSEQMGLAGEVLGHARVTMLRAELGLLQRFAYLYSKRDAAKASHFDSDLEVAIQPYHALAIAGDAPAEGEVDDSELERLQTENARLSEELRVTMETMSRMLSEYSTLFVGETPTVDAAAVSPIAAAVGGIVAAEVADNIPGDDASAADAAGARQDSNHEPGSSVARATPGDLPGEGGAGDPVVHKTERASDASEYEDLAAVDDFEDVSVMLEEGGVEVMAADELEGIPMDAPPDDIDEALFDGFDETPTAAAEATDGSRAPVMNQKA